MRRTSVRRLSRGGRHELRILVSVDDGTRPGRLNPLAEELLLASLHGEMVGEYTVATRATTRAASPGRAAGDPGDGRAGRPAARRQLRMTW